MTRYSPAADRLRRQRLIFARAVADKVSMAEAKRRIDADHIELSRRARAEVGRWRDVAAPPPAQSSQEPTRTRFWWEDQ